MKTKYSSAQEDILVDNDSLENLLKINNQINQQSN